MPEPTLVKLSEIKPNPYQPRTAEDTAAIAEIAVNIFRNGLMQIPSARRVNGHYELVFGHTRKAAYDLLATQGVPSADIAPDKRYSQMPLYIHDLDDRQMFEMAVAENIKRRDLNPIEQATAMQRYMNEFDANSKQAAELFGMSDATVRGVVRLLDLPKQVQDKVASGELSQSAARALLSMQKVAPESEVVATLKKIEKEKGDLLPEEVIENQIENLKNVIDLWNDNRRDGKPRAGYYGWLLDMKNFPNHLLPAMSEQQVGAFEAHLEHLINPPACTACPFYTKVRGSHFCGMKVCHERKTLAWQKHAVEQASKKTKIPVYVEEDGAYRPLDYTTACRTLFEKKHKDLRLIQRKAIGGYTYQNYTGLDDDLVVVVATGDLLGKLASTSVGRATGGKKTNAEKVEMKRLKMYRVHRKTLLWEFTASAKAMFDAVPGIVLERLNGWKYLGVDQHPPVEKPSDKDKDALSEYNRRLIIWRMVEDQSSHYRRDTLISIYEDLMEFSKEWKVKVPTSLRKFAEQADDEIKAVSVETGKGKK